MHPPARREQPPRASLFGLKSCNINTFFISWGICASLGQRQHRRIQTAPAAVFCTRRDFCFLISGSVTLSTTDPYGGRTIPLWGADSTPGPYALDARSTLPQCDNHTCPQTQPLILPQGSKGVSCQMSRWKWHRGAFWPGGCERQCCLLWCSRGTSTWGAQPRIPATAKCLPPRLKVPRLGPPPGGAARM